MNKPRAPRSHSLATFVNVNMVGVFVIFIMLAAIAYNKLASFRDVMFTLSNDAMPKIVSVTTINNEVHNLALGAVSLANANSNASRRIALQHVEGSVAKLKQLSAGSVSQDSLFQKLDIFEYELSELEKLVQLKLDSIELVDARHQQVIDFVEDIEASSAQTIQTTQLNFGSLQWIWVFNRITSLTGKLVNSDKLQQIRALNEAIDSSIEELSEASAQLDVRLKSIGTQYHQSLAKMLTGEDGLIALKTNQLKIASRARGRGQFASNLIIDFAKLSEFKSYQLSDSTLEQARASSAQLDFQFKLFIGLFFLGVALVISLVLFIQFRVVSRLSKLNKYINQRQSGQKQHIALPGKDEISLLANTFDGFASTIEEQKQELTHLSLSDQLTDVPNRRALDARLLSDMHTAARQKWLLSLLMVDVDFFKRYNDNYGHTAGDECLKHIASILAKSLPRASDFIARFGGEEFACILPDTDEEGAKQVAEKLIHDISEANIPHAHSKIASHITVSIGLITYSASEPVAPSELIGLADVALYKAKQKGRNQWVSYSDKLFD